MRRAIMGRSEEVINRYWSLGGWLLAVILGLLVAGGSWWQLGAVVVGPIIVLGVLRWPLLGVGLTLLAGPWGALESYFLGASWPESGQLLFLLTVVSWVGRGLGRRRLVVPRVDLVWVLLAFMMVMGVTLFDAEGVLLGVKELVKWGEMVVMVVIVVDLVEEKGANGLWWLLGLLLVVGLSQALVGVWQFGLRGTGPFHFQILGGRFY
ncbi:MAG TPA: hypothetical protein VLL52_17610, partial [Anaerolineae bacterium]|nr:hypothetical protein [Anaerolineae bacterium]